MVHDLTFNLKDQMGDPNAGILVSIKLVDRKTGKAIVAPVNTLDGTTVSTDIQKSTDPDGNLVVPLTPNKDIANIQTRYRVTIHGVSNTVIMPRRDVNFRDLLLVKEEYITPVNTFNTLETTEGLIGRNMVRIYRDTLDASTPVNSINIATVSNSNRENVAISHIDGNGESDRDYLNRMPAGTTITLLDQDKIQDRRYRITGDSSEIVHGSTAFTVFPCLRTEDSGNADFADGEVVTINVNFIDVVGIEEGTVPETPGLSNKTPLPDSPTGNPGTGNQPPRDDHQHPLNHDHPEPDIPEPSDDTPLPDSDNGSAGTDEEYSRGGHQHPKTPVGTDDIDVTTQITTGDGGKVITVDPDDTEKFKAVPPSEVGGGGTDPQTAINTTNITNNTERITNLENERVGARLRFYPETVKVYTDLQTDCTVVLDELKQDILFDDVSPAIDQIRIIERGSNTVVHTESWSYTGGDQEIHFNISAEEATAMGTSGASDFVEFFLEFRASGSIVALTNTIVVAIGTDGEFPATRAELSEGGGDFQGDYNASTTYNKGQTVFYQNNFWFSVIDSNTGNTPDPNSRTNWIIVGGSTGGGDFQGTFNTSITYRQGQVVFFENNFWISAQSSNTNNMPNIHRRTWWILIGREFVWHIWVSGEDYTSGEIVRVSNNYYLCIVAIRNSTTSPGSDTTHWIRIFNPPPENRLIPSGGTTGQAIVKNSNRDFDVGWGDVSGGTGGSGRNTKTLIGTSNATSGVNERYALGLKSDGRFNTETVISISKQVVDDAAPLGVKHIDTHNNIAFPSGFRNTNIGNSNTNAMVVLNGSTNNVLLLETGGGSQGETMDNNLYVASFDFGSDIDESATSGSENTHTLTWVKHDLAFTEELFNRNPRMSVLKMSDTDVRLFITSSGITQSITEDGTTNTYVNGYAVGVFNQGNNTIATPFTIKRFSTDSYMGIPQHAISPGQVVFDTQLYNGNMYAFIPYTRLEVGDRTTRRYGIHRFIYNQDDNSLTIDRQFPNLVGISGTGGNSVFYATPIFSWVERERLGTTARIYTHVARREIASSFIAIDISYLNNSTRQITTGGENTGASFSGVDFRGLGTEVNIQSRSRITWTLSNNDDGEFGVSGITGDQVITYDAILENTDTAFFIVETENSEGTGTSRIFLPVGEAYDHLMFYTEGTGSYTYEVFENLVNAHDIGITNPFVPNGTVFKVYTYTLDGGGTASTDQTARDAAAAAQATADANEATIDRLATFGQLTVYPGGIADSNVPEFISIDLDEKITDKTLTRILVSLEGNNIANIQQTADLEPFNIAVRPGGVINCSLTQNQRNNLSTNIGSSKQFIQGIISYTFSDGTTARQYWNFGTNNNGYAVRAGADQTARDAAAAAQNTANTAASAAATNTANITTNTNNITTFGETVQANQQAIARITPPVPQTIVFNQATQTNHATPTFLTVGRYNAGSIIPAITPPSNTFTVRAGAYIIDITATLVNNEGTGRQPTSRLDIVYILLNNVGNATLATSTQQYIRTGNGAIVSVHEEMIVYLATDTVCRLQVDNIAESTGETDTNYTVRNTSLQFFKIL